MSLNYKRNDDGEMVELEQGSAVAGDLVVYNRESLCFVVSVEKKKRTDRWGVEIGEDVTLYTLQKVESELKKNEVDYWLVQKVEEYV